jgi:hypothetical protein
VQAGGGAEKRAAGWGENREATLCLLFPTARIIKQVFQSQGLDVKERAVNVCLYGILTKEKVVLWLHPFRE